MPSIPASRSSLAPSNPAIEVKGTIAPVTVLCLRSADIDRVEQELRARIAPAPQLFLNAPIVIDLADLEGDVEAELLAELIGRLRACRLIPVGVAHLPAERLSLAADVGLAIVQLGFGRSRGARASSSLPMPAPSAPPAPAVAPVAQPPARAIEKEPVALESPSTLTITQPVRGGQVVYAQRSDAVVLAPVNPGAQVIADGHVHVYGRLRGRALAGARGQAEARVFCQSLEAELVSVAGEFITAEDIPNELRGRPAQIFVDKGVVRVAPL
jgi:septum site-determining protein MinC